MIAFRFATVAVDKAAAGVHEFGDFLDVGLEQAKRVRVRDHDPGAVVIHQGGHVLNGQDAVRGPSGTFTDEKPHRAALAGLVPCAVSGMSILVRVLPCARCHA